MVISSPHLFWTILVGLHAYLPVVCVTGFIVPQSQNHGTSRHLGLHRCHGTNHGQLHLSTVGTSEKADEPLPRQESAVGMREDALFRLDDSVHFWKDFESEGNDGNLRRMTQILQDYVLSPSSSTTLSRAYWGSHLLRSGYFTANAFLGSAASDLHERYIATRGSTSRGGSTEHDSSSAAAAVSPILAANQSGTMVSRLVQSDIPSRLLLETLKTYEQDYTAIEKGILKYPWDALVQYHEKGTNIELQLRHRQFNPFFALSETRETIAESIAIFSRRNKGASQGVAWQAPQSFLYPDYYMNDFHYQTDGWLSSLSARRYEITTETLFLGRQDAMQRQTLLPLLKKQNLPKTILEVGCGTGRFATFLRDNLPEADVTLSDLSPYYLEKARENDAYWRKFTKRDKMGTKPATCVQANAEQLPFPDDSFDAVISIYLFHEMPETARNRAAAEMVRVCKPGGTIVLTDSMQYGDRPKFENIANFAKLNEPHYQNYVEHAYLPDLFAGTECDEKFMASSTKTVSFVKIP